jgi:hypothetical protein
MERDAKLLQIVDTLSATRRFPGGLDRRQQQRYEDAYDGDYHKQFHKRKAAKVSLHDRFPRFGNSSIYFPARVWILNSK